MRLHYLQHVPFEGLGSIGAWAAAAGHQVSVSRMFADDPLPATTRFDWLLVMGGPMGVNDTTCHPWLTGEKKFIAAAIAAGKTVLGICLGAQLLAAVLGAAVYPNREKEIGWLPVYRVPDGAGLPLTARLPDGEEVFHWHGDTFDLPAGACHLLRSAACENQAFLYGERVLALQFHLETTPAGAAALVEHCARDLAPGPRVQPAARIMADESRFTRLNRRMNAVLDFLAAGCSATPG